MYESALQYIAVHHSILWAIDITTLAVAVTQLVIGLAPQWRAPLMMALHHRAGHQDMHPAGH